jgi:hypothetical protein
MGEGALHVASRAIGQLLDEDVTCLAVLVGSGTSGLEAVFSKQPDVG